MKKIITILAVVAMFSFQGCTGPEGPQGPEGVPGQDGAVPLAFEIKNINLVKVSNNEYKLSNTFQYEMGGNLYDNETVLVYRMTGVVNSTTPIWQLIPRTIRFTNGDVLEYYFDFSKVDFVITAYGNYNLSLGSSDYINDQTFRFVIVPSNLLASVNKNNYNEVISALNIKENQIQKINF